MNPTAEERDALFKAFGRAFFKQDLDAMYQVVTDDFTYSILVNDQPRRMNTREQVAAFFEERQGIQKDVRFKQLGLVIIDEEQRFGVQQKERLKQLRAEVDLLTLTATPIPRTLNMAMSGIRDLSIIATPPARRMAVKTLITEWDRATLREALMREMLALRDEFRALRALQGD